MITNNNSCHRKRGKTLGLPELIAIALGGMVGGGIFSILGISVSLIGAFTPLAFLIGGIIAMMAAYSYVQLGVYYKDEGATYSFYKKTYSDSSFSASLIGWWVIFGYISTLALYAYTFSSYAISGFSFGENEWVRKIVAGGIIFVFMLINIWSVKGMGKIEDIMVYTKLVILIVISIILISNTQTSIPRLLSESSDVNFLTILIVASITFVAYEGFQLVINATNEMNNPERNIPIAIYSSIFIAALIYIVLSLGALLAIPFDAIIQDKEYALASGTDKVIGHWGTNLVIIGALLATSSAISGTMFGASRQIAVIAKDGYFPRILSKKSHNIPVNAVIAMAIFSFILVLTGSLQVILEFSSFTFLVVSLLMAIANHKIRKSTKSSFIVTTLSIITLFIGVVFILYYEYTYQPQQLFFIGGLYSLLTLSAWLYSKKNIKA
jgi:amino acid transporter